ncbi:hypothetical protein FRC15_000775 [Serendipita sp. 397]|nr:hypothetical protein FRC15_000775 [Serendipita sp. 397]
MSRVGITSQFLTRGLIRTTNRLNIPTRAQAGTFNTFSFTQYSWERRRCMASMVAPSTVPVPNEGTSVYTGGIPLEQFLNKQLLAARKSKDAFRTNVLRTVIGELQTELKLKASKQKETDQNLETVAIKSLRMAISKRKTAAKEYRGSGLESTAEVEEKEAAYLSSILPKEISGEQLRSEVTRQYTEGKETGVFEPGDKSKIPTILTQIVESLEKEHGKGSIATGEVARILMPLIQPKAGKQGDRST